jgi:hypothetical protein
MDLSAVVPCWPRPIGCDDGFGDRDRKIISGEKEAGEKRIAKEEEDKLLYTGLKKGITKRGAGSRK